MLRLAVEALTGAQGPVLAVARATDLDGIGRNLRGGDRGPRIAVADGARFGIGFA